MMADQISLVREAGDQDRTSWDNFVRSHPQGSIYHLWRWRRLFSDLFGHQTYYLVLPGETSEFAGILPIVRLNSWMFGDFLISLPYFNYGGALGINATAEHTLMSGAVELAGRLGVQHVEFRDRGKRSLDWPCRTDKVTMVLKLPQDPDILWKSFGSKLRAQIKRPMREDVRIKSGGREYVEQFYSVFARNMRDLGTPVYSRQFFNCVLEIMGNDAEILLIEFEGKPAAAALLLHGYGKTEIPWASAIRDYNRFSINMLLYWKALEIAISRGSEAFDFGRSTREGGGYKFKKQWGSESRQLHWHYWLREGKAIPLLAPSNPKFQLVIRLWRCLPVAITKLVGPQIVRYLP